MVAVAHDALVVRLVPVVLFKCSSQLSCGKLPVGVRRVLPIGVAGLEGVVWLYSCGVSLRFRLLVARSHFGCLVLCLRRVVPGVHLPG